MDIKVEIEAVGVSISEQDRSFASPFHSPVCSAREAMGDECWTRSGNVWHTLAPTNEGFYHL